MVLAKSIHMPKEVICFTSPLRTHILCRLVGGSKLSLPVLTICNQLNFLHYAPMAPYPQKLLPFQKNIHSFFLSDNIREELQRKGEAALQTMPSKLAFEAGGRARPR